MNRTQLADFLRSRRARIQPTDVGLPAGRRRRTAGLRREEVASLAAISVDYYTRLEQARGPQPSRQVLASLARALRLSNAERAYLVDVATETRQAFTKPSSDVPAGILHLLDRLYDTPGYVLDAKWDILAWNAMADALMLDLSATPDRDRNAMRWLFMHAPAEEADESHHHRAQEAVADLLAAAARYPDDPGVRGLIADMTASSTLFAELWARHDVRVRRSTHKRVIHPVVGLLELDIETLLIAERDQRLVLYTAAPGTTSHDALRLLRVIGTQNMTPATETSRTP